MNLTCSGGGASLPPSTVPDEALTKLRSFAQHCSDFPRKGRPGVEHIRAKVVCGGVADDLTGQHVAHFVVTIECLTYRNRKGDIVGILHYYPQEVKFGDMVIEEQGSVNVFVRPDRLRRGIGTKLIAEADRRWSPDWSAQRYTKAGRALVANYLDWHGSVRRDREVPDA